MTKDEFTTQVKSLVSDISPEQKVAVKRVIDNVHGMFMSWTHCHHCGRSNHRYFEDYRDEYEELKKECAGDTCIHCGKGVTVYCGYRNGETTVLPSRADILVRIKNAIAFGSDELVV